jgi:PAS domain S-box-containing protein
MRTAVKGHAVPPVDSTPLARMRSLLEVADLARGDRELDEVLDAIATTIATGLGWRTVAVNVYRPAWDDFQVTTVYGGEAVRAALFGGTSTWEQWKPLFDARFKRGGAYLVDHRELELEPSEAIPSYFPPLERSDDPEAWASEHGLIVPLAHSDGHLVGILSVDEPLSGRLPTAEELELLSAVAAQAARAVEHVQRQAELDRYRAALEHLHDVSARLTPSLSRERVLQAVAQGIRLSLGFHKVCISLLDGDGFTTAALSGWAPDDPSASTRIPKHEFELLLEPRFEVEGSYLLSRTEALERCSTGADYASRMNGRGPWAWNRHWLVTPLRDATGELIGFIWVDDPDDRQLPSREKLRVLRMFCNHAEAALELRRTLAAEQQANETLRASITASPLATFSVDAAGIVRSWNPAAERMYGWSADEVVGRPYPLIGPDQRVEFEHLLRSVLDGSSFSGVEVARVARDGRVFDVSASAAPLRNAAGEIERALILHADVTELKSASRELERRKQELEALHSTTLEVVEHLDRERAIEAVVARACELLDTEHGYVYLAKDDEELELGLATGVFGEFVGERLKRGEGSAGRIWETGETLVVDSYTGWDGRAGQFEQLGFHAVAAVPLRSKSGFLGVLGVGRRDDTGFTPEGIALLEQFGRLASLALENAQLFEEVRQSRELYARVLETSTDVMVLFGLDGTIEFASRATEAVFGWKPEEIIGQNFAKLVHPDDAADAGAVIAEALATDVSRPATARLRHRDGRWVVVEGKPAVIRNEHGDPELILGIARDVSERVEAEERRCELEAQLRQSQKMEAVGSLAGGIAHDFNNLLTAINGYGGLAIAAVPEGHVQLVADIEEMLEASERARQLIRQLLAFSRKQVLQPRDIDLNEVVTNIQSILGRLIGGEVELVTSLDPDLGHVSADPGQIEQVVMNLCLNARDAMPGGGRLVIETANAHLDSAFVERYVGAPAGPCIALRVSDTGHGMSDDVRPRIFEPFFTTKEEGRGTGLGLSTVYGIVRQSGGYIWCDSTVGEGTTFTVYLPRIEPDAAATRPAALAAVDL